MGTDVEVEITQQKSSLRPLLTICLRSLVQGVELLQQFHIGDLVQFHPLVNQLIGVIRVEIILLFRGTPIDVVYIIAEDALH